MYKFLYKLIGNPFSSSSSLQNIQAPPDNPASPSLELCWSQRSRYLPPKLSVFVCNNVETPTFVCPTSVPSSSSSTCSYPLTQYISDKKIFLCYKAFISGFPDSQMPYLFLTGEMPCEVKLIL